MGVGDSLDSSAQKEKGNTSAGGLKYSNRTKGRMEEERSKGALSERGMSSVAIWFRTRESSLIKLLLRGKTKEAKKKQPTSFVTRTNRVTVRGLAGRGGARGTGLKAKKR